jgi:gas vesicle protein
MPSDPVYNPQLPSSSLASASGSPWSSSSSSMSSSESCSSWSSLAAGLCAGAAAGAALALIFTPMRGSDMRNSVRSYASQGGTRLSELLESGRCLAEDAVHQASALIEEGRRAFRTNSSLSASGSSSSSSSAMSSSSYSSSQPLTASVAEISGLDSRFEEPLGG